MSKPRSGFGIQNIRKMRSPGPYCTCKVFSVLILAKIILPHAFLVDRIAFFDLYSGIDNRHQMYTLCFHFCYKLFKIRKFFRIDCKVFKAFHIIDIHIHGVQRNSLFMISFYHFPYIVRTCITPARLLIAERPFRRDIARPDQLPKLLCDLYKAVVFDRINHTILTHRNAKPVDLRFADIERHSARVVNKNTKRLPIFSAQNEKIVRSIQRMPVLQMKRIVCRIANISKSTLIDSTHLLSQSVNHILFLHLATQFYPVRRLCKLHQMKRLCTLWYLSDNRSRFQRLTKAVFFNHDKLLLVLIFYRGKA